MFMQQMLNVTKLNESIIFDSFNEFFKAHNIINFYFDNFDNNARKITVFNKECSDPRAALIYYFSHDNKDIITYTPEELFIYFKYVLTHIDQNIKIYNSSKFSLSSILLELVEDINSSRFDKDKLSSFIIFFKKVLPYIKYDIKIMNTLLHATNKIKDSHVKLVRKLQMLVVYNILNEYDKFNIYDFNINLHLNAVYANSFDYSLHTANKHMDLYPTLINQLYDLFKYDNEILRELIETNYFGILIDMLPIEHLKDIINMCNSNKLQLDEFSLEYCKVRLKNKEAELNYKIKVISNEIKRIGTIN